MYIVTYSDDALRSIALYKKSDPASYKKVMRLFCELHEHPRTGTGKPEALKWLEGDVYSRAVNKKDRLVYEIYDDEVSVYVVSVEGHYSDK